MNTQQSPPIKLIACMESYLYPSIPIGPFPSEATSPALSIIPSPILTKLKNLGPTRAKDMRSLGQVRQVVSHVPIAASSASCTKFNDSLYAAIQLNTDKVSALALLPCGAGDGREAAKELQRCVGKMRFVGGMLSLGKNGAKELCGESYGELWAAAERFRVPIMLRTMWPTGNELAAYRINSTGVTFASLGMHFHTAQSDSPLCILHLYLSGVFDRHPRLHVVLSNPGLLPSLLSRVEHILSSFAPINKPKRSFLDVWKSNIFVTTADVLNMSTMRMLLEQTPIDRVLYATNYPFEERSKELMCALRQSDFLSTGDFERIAWKNAENVFNL